MGKLKLSVKTGLKGYILLNILQGFKVLEDIDSDSSLVKWNQTCSVILIVLLVKVLKFFQLNPSEFG
jgi:hypothetical protein